MFTELLKQVTSSDRTQNNIITDGRLEIAYGELRQAVESIGDYFLSLEIDAQSCLAFECPNTVTAALTVLAMMDRGIGFVVLPHRQENQPDLKPVPRFCEHRVSVDTTTDGLGDDWTRHPERFLVVERNDQFQPLPGEISHGPRRIYLRTSGSMGTSKIVATALTPGNFSAAEVSILFTLAWACGLRRSFACSILSSLMSAAYLAEPVTLSKPSIRGRDFPTAI